MNPESSIRRIIGVETPKLSKVKAKEILVDKFSNPEFSDLEREKTSEEIQMIGIANEATNKILSENGVEPWSVPVQNIHLIKEEEWAKRKDKGATAIYYNTFQGIVLGNIPQKLVFTKTLIHELLHFKSFNAIELVDGELRTQRTGIETSTRPEQKVVLKAINEAVIEELAGQAISTIDDPLLTNEQEETRKILEKSSKENVYYASLVSETGNTKTHAFGYLAYPAQRKILHSLIEKIVAKSQGSQTSEEVFSVFVHALFKSNLIELGKLIESSFGVGTFRKIAEFNNDHEGLKKYIESL